MLSSKKPRKMQVFLPEVKESGDLVMFKPLKVFITIIQFFFLERRRNYFLCKIR